MKEGTKSILFGCHNFVVHPFFVIIGWVYWHGRFPRFWEIICIIVHDWGVWGKDYLTDPASKDRHPEYGAAIAERLFGDKGWRLVAGHTPKYVDLWNRDRFGLGRIKCNNDDHPSKLEKSDLFFADKYSWLIIPPCFLKFQTWVEPELQEQGHWNRVRSFALRSLATGEDMHGLWAATVYGGVDDAED